MPENGADKNRTMKLRALSILLAMCVAMSLTGCGVGGGSTAAVSVTILNPMTGTTVGVHRVTVAGTVSPANATLYLNGIPINVVDGSYTVPVAVWQPKQQITLTGIAKGYLKGTASTTVLYSAGTASARPTLDASIDVPGPAFFANKHSATKPASHASPVHAATGSSSTSPATAASHASAATIPSQPSPAVSAPTPASTPHSAPAPHQSAPTLRTASQHKTTHASHRSTRVVKPTPKPADPVLTALDIRRAWVGACVRAGKDDGYLRYCRCTYYHLEKHGVLSSRDELLALQRRLAPYNRTHDLRRLPRFIRRVVFTCASKLPPLDPIGGKPVVSKLPGASHQAAAPSGQPQLTATAPAASSPIATTGPLATIARSAVHEFNIALRMLTHHKPATATPNDRRSARKSHRRASALWRAPERRHHWTI